MVELGAIGVESHPLDPSASPTREELLANPLHHDAWRLKHLVTTHADLVDSSRAQEIRDNFDAFIGKFVKVTPHEFRRAIEARETKAGAA